MFLVKKDSWTNGQQYEQYGSKDKGIIWWYRTRDINQNRKKWPYTIYRWLANYPTCNYKRRRAGGVSFWKKKCLSDQDKWWLYWIFSPRRWNQSHKEYTNKTGRAIWCSDCIRSWAWRKWYWGIKQWWTNRRKDITLSTAIKVKRR